ncbi:FAD:protein FMN transferase [Mangrovibacterium marinum]|nr:FAD:protein FMN transferase [Mangrovibacterium marinum]
MTGSLHAFSAETYTRSLKLMGSRFDITVVAENEPEGNKFIDLAVAEIRRIEKLISSWDEHSQTAEINRKAGIQPVVVAPELFQLIERAMAISRLTDGAFDISYASMDKIWKFDGTMTEMPSPEAIEASVAKVGFEHIILNPESHSIYLDRRGMKIGFGAIGKGYAADRAKTLLMGQGVPAGIINASGDMNTWGVQPSGEEWKVGIVNPFNKTKVFAVLPLQRGAVVTSGDYEKYVRFNGVRYTHIINPQTGYPATGIISATVFAPKAELADALATSIFVMGIDVGLNRINQLPQVECILIDETGKIYSSDHLKIEKE